MPPGAPSAVPGGQGVHAAAPAVAYVPTGHVAQAAPAAAAEPAGHAAQLAASVAPALLVLVPAGHALHVAELAAVAYVPSAQGAQSAAPAADDVPAGHETQTPDVRDAEPGAHGEDAHGCRKPVPAVAESHVKATVSAVLAALAASSWPDVASMARPVTDAGGAASVFVAAAVLSEYVMTAPKAFCTA